MNNLPLKGRGDEHVFDYSKITEAIYIGSDLCKGGVCLIHGEEFRALGVSVELNLSQEYNELPPKNLETYVWLPVPDGYAPSQAQLDLGTSVINEAVMSGKIVYVHCKNGHARSPSLIVAYLMRFKAMSMEEALALIKKARAEVHVEDTQIAALKEFAQKWSK